MGQLVEGSPARRVSACLCLASAVACGIVLRTVFLTSKSFWTDEGFTAFMARTEWHTFVRLLRTSEMNMALYYVLMRGWAQFGIGEFWLRFFSVLASTATLPVIYFVGKQLGGRRTGLIAAWLLALHPGHIVYAQEARSYALEVLLFSIAIWCVLQFVENGSSVTWVGFVTASVASIYCHVLALLASPATVVPMAASRKYLRNPAVAIFTVIAFLVMLPLVFFGVTKAGTVASWIPPLSWHTAADSFRLVTLPKFDFLYVVAWGLAMYSGFGRSQRSGRWVLVFLLCWLLLPGLLLAAISLYKPIFLARALLICVPAACLLAAMGIGVLPRVPMLVALALILATSLKADVLQYRRFDAKEDWRGAAAYVCAHSARHDRVDVVPAYGRFSFDYYRELYGLPEGQFIYAGENRELVSARTWLVVFGAVGTNPTATAALAAVDAPGGAPCIVRSAQFNLVEVWLLQPCPAK